MKSPNFSLFMKSVQTPMQKQTIKALLVIIAQLPKLFTMRSSHS